MKSNLYTVYDTVAEEGGPIFQARNHAVALRNFRAMFNREDVTANIAEFRLYWVGEFNDEELKIRPVEPREEVLSDLGTTAPFGAPVGAGG